MSRDVVARLVAYHEEFVGDTWGLCRLCEGECERHAISCLVPGEVELISEFLGTSPREFRQQHTDSIRTSRGVVTVMRLCTRCPFLSDDFRCTVKAVKPVMCDIYPVYAEVRGEGRVAFGLDPKCALAHYGPSARYFRMRGIPALRRLGVAAEVYAAVEEFDCEAYDFDRLDCQRRGRARKVFSLAEVRRAVVDRRPGTLARLWRGPDAVAGRDERVAALFRTLREAGEEIRAWRRAAKLARGLKERYTTTDDADYIVALLHVAEARGGSPERKDLHRAIARAALERVPGPNRRNALHRWLREMLSW